MKITFGLLAASTAFLLLASSPAAATAVNWTLSGVTFDDGAIATGGFTYDADTNLVSAFSVSTNGGYQLSPYTYGPGDVVFGSNNDLFFVKSAFDRYLRFGTLAPLTNAGGTVALNTVSYASYECSNCGNVRAVTAGSLIAGGVPEPAAWAMMVAGFGAIGMTLRSRRKTSVSFG